MFWSSAEWTYDDALSGRRAQAARNDELILDAARAVFVADPGAPIAAVAERAGVGISALYRRHGTKEDLLRQLCADRLVLYIAAAKDALTDDCRHPLLTISLAGTFTATDELRAAATRAGELAAAIVEGPTQPVCCAPTWWPPTSPCCSNSSRPCTAPTTPAPTSCGCATSTCCSTPCGYPPGPGRCPGRPRAPVGSPNAGAGADWLPQSENTADTTTPLRAGPERFVLLQWNGTVCSARRSCQETR